MALLELLDKIDKNQELIGSYGKYDDSILKKINYKFRLDWNYHSNSMEGNSLTKAETRSLMVDAMDINGKSFKDVKEMRGHDNIVMDMLKISHGTLRLSEKRIKEIHKAIIYSEIQEEIDQIGLWKTTNNHLINYKGEKFDFTDHELVKDKMHELLNWLNAELDTIFQKKKVHIHPVELAAEFHIRYLTIHPFFDGNGRTARLLSNLILISTGYPPVIIKKEEKENIYYKSLADIQAYGGDTDIFNSFFAEKVIESQKLILDALEGKDIDEPDDLDKRIEMLKKLKSIDKITLEKNKETIYSVIKEVAFPLFEAIEEKCTKLNDLYMDHSKKITYQSHRDNAVRQVGSTLSKWNELKANWLEAKLQITDLDMKSISFTYNLTGFKQNIIGLSCMTQIEFKFERFNYSILHFRENSDKAITKVYGEPLSTEEKQLLITKAVGALVDDTERYAQMK